MYQVTCVLESYPYASYWIISWLHCVCWAWHINLGIGIMDVITNINSFCDALYLFPELVKSGSEGFSAGLIDDEDVYKWEVVIYGPPDTLL